MYEIIEELNESLGNLEAGSQTFKEIIKVLLKGKHKFGQLVSPQSKVINLGVTNSRQLYSKAVSAVGDDKIAAIYIVNDSFEGLVVVHHDPRDHLRSSEIQLISKRHGTWDFDEVLGTPSGRGMYRLKDLSKLGIEGTFEAAIITADDNRRFKVRDRGVATGFIDPMEPGIIRDVKRKQRLQDIKDAKINTGYVDAQKFRNLLKFDGQIIRIDGEPRLFEMNAKIDWVGSSSDLTPIAKFLDPDTLKVTHTAWLEYTRSGILVKVF